MLLTPRDAVVRLVGPLVLPCLIVGAIVGTTHFIFPAALVFLLAFPSRRAYRACVDAVQWAWLSGAAALLEMVARVKVVTSGDDMPHPSDRVVVIVLNHHCRLDWMFFWCLAARLKVYCICLAAASALLGRVL